MHPGFPTAPPLNPIPVPSSNAESRKRFREEDEANDENAKRLATAPEVLFRLLVPANRVGKLIGKQGMHIKQLRDETGARIRIAEAQSTIHAFFFTFSGGRHISIVSPFWVIISAKFQSYLFIVTRLQLLFAVCLVHNFNKPVEDRVVIISSKDEPGEPKCAAEHALLRVATLLIEPGPGDSLVMVTIGPQHHASPNLTRLLIAGSQAGGVIGKGGAGIKEIREMSGAIVRILSKDQLPLCSSASESDRLMQMSGEVPQVQKALELIAAKLRENPPRDTLKSIHPSLLFTASALQQQMLLSDASQIALFDTAPFSTVIQQHDGTEYVVPLPIISKVAAEMTVPSSLIGGVIGRGGANITQVRQLSGAAIKVRGQKDGASHRVIYFEGSSEQVSVAQSLVEAFLTQQQK